AGHAVPRDADQGRIRPGGRFADAVAHAYLVDPDPAHAGTPAADPHRGTWPGVSPRRSRSDALAGLRPDRSAGRRRRHLAWRSERHAAGVRAADVLADRARAIPAELLPVHGAQRGNRSELLAVRRRRLRDVQEDRLDRD